MMISLSILKIYLEMLLLTKIINIFAQNINYEKEQAH